MAHWLALDRIARGNPAAEKVSHVGPPTPLLQDVSEDRATDPDAA
jgi:hypothetical protein